MDQSFRIAVWMFFLVGYLQASPVPVSKCSMNTDDLFFYDPQNVKCENVTFTYPTDVTIECFEAALAHFEKGFGDASVKCESSRLGLGEAINLTQEALKRGLTQKQCMPQTQATCNLNLTVHGEFANFSNAAQKVVELFNRYQQLKKK